MIAHIFVERNLELSIEGSISAIELYVSGFKRGAGFYAGHDIIVVLQNEDGIYYEIDHSDIEKELIDQIGKLNLQIEKIN